MELALPLELVCCSGVGVGAAEALLTLLVVVSVATETIGSTDAATVVVVVADMVGDILDAGGGEASV